MFSNITLEMTSPAFNDKPIDINEWYEDINSYYLYRLASTSNKFLLPTIKCPWGCSGFQHKVGYLPLDVVFQINLQEISLEVLTNKQLSFHKKVRIIR